MPVIWQDLEIDLTEWHTYRVQWREDYIGIFIDDMGTPIAELTDPGTIPSVGLNFTTWIDNYLVTGGLTDPTFGYLNVPDMDQYIDVDYVKIYRSACSNSVDDDGDGLADYPDDPGCTGPAGDIEDPQCQDGINNDPGQDPDPGLIDFDGGQSIWGACTGQPGGCPANVSDPGGDGVANPDPQCVEKPWRNYENMRTSTCGLGSEVALLLPPLIWLSARRRRHA